MKSKLIVIIFLTIAAFVFFNENVFACAPGSPSDVYESKDILGDYYPLVERVDSKTSEDYPILNQNYGVITPGWGIEYLLPSFLTVENINLPSEIKNRLYQYYKRTGWDATFYQSADPNQESIDKWLEIRKIYIKEPYSSEKDYSIEYNLSSCADQALNRAVEDYEYRKSRFSETELETWVKNQDKVFQNCLIKETVANGKISKTQNWWQAIKVYLKNFNKKAVSADDVSAPELLEYDQEYQRAASVYYSKNYSLAAKLFRDMADDKSHPHRLLAALSLGWSYIGWDESSYEVDLKAEKPDTEDNYIKNLKQTQEYYEKMLSESDYTSVKHEFQKYLDFVIFRADPVRRLVDAEKTLLDPGEVKEFARQLEDFNRLWYKYFQRVLINQKEETKHKEFSEKISKSQSPFLRFLLEWEKPTPEGIQYSLENYKSNKNPLWLILALRQSNEGQKDFGFIKDEINKITQESPFYLTARYYLLEQLAKVEKNKETAKEIAEKYMEETFAKDQLAAFNLFADIRENLASSPQESFKFSIRYSLATYDENWDSIPFVPYYSYGYSNPTESKKDPLFSNKTKSYLGSLSSKDLSQFVIENSGFLKDSLARYLKLTTFYRLLVLDDLESADLMAKNIVSTDQVLSSILGQYLSAENPTTKRFIAAKILIDFPLVYPQIGEHFDNLANTPVSNWMRIDNYRRNWSSRDACMDPEYRPKDYFESEIDKEVNKNLDNFLEEILLDYMMKNPNSLDPKLLHQIVDSCHYAACGDSETSNIAKQAFQLLYSRYPGNYWTKQTPYWY